MGAPDDIAPLVLILAGTTASGKTDVSIPLALGLNAEIISADSRQVYRELAIGSAPPNSDQLAAVKHHFIASKSISERWTAGDFAREAREIIVERARSGLHTVVVGGSMLYLRALVDGLYESSSEPHIDYRALKEEWERRGADAMMNELRVVDSAIAARTNVADYHRILRAIGHFRATGVSLSQARGGATPALHAPHKFYFLFGDREETYARVNVRVDKMLDMGLVEEVRRLWQSGFDETNTNPLRTHGYQEVFPYLREEMSFETMRFEIQKAVRHYVKRQLTWFRNNSQVVRVERRFDEPPELIARRILMQYLGAGI